jgi:repressor of nif and glnA expression
MKLAFDTGLCVSKLVAVADYRQPVDGLIIPEEKIGLITVCSAVINGALLKSEVNSFFRSAEKHREILSFRQ